MWNKEHRTLTWISNYHVCFMHCLNRRCWEEVIKIENILSNHMASLCFMFYYVTELPLSKACVCTNPLQIRHNLSVHATQEDPWEVVSLTGKGYSSHRSTTSTTGIYKGLFEWETFINLARYPRKLPLHLFDSQLSHYILCVWLVVHGFSMLCSSFKRQDIQSKQKTKNSAELGQIRIEPKSNMCKTLAK